MEREEIIAGLLKAAGGQLVGRVRLQKTAYLLDELGLESGFRYDYYHYGPFSRDIDNAVVDAEAFGLVEEKLSRRVIDGARYSIFTLTVTEREIPAPVGRLKEAALKDYLKTFASANITVLELAATANWLFVKEHQKDWREALCRLKGPKAEGGRLDQALDLLRAVNLPPATADASA